MPDYFINVKEKGAKKAAGNIKSLTSSMKMMALQAVSVTAVVQGLKKSIQMSAEMEGVKRGFDNLAKSSGFSTLAFDKFRAATDGTIDSMTLMKQANNAMLLGITDSEDQMANMFDVAQRLGQSLGVDTVQAVESLVTGLGRQSKLMLDNLGIMVDTGKAYDNYATSIGKTTAQLTDQERKTAFTNAAMKEANSLVAQLGEEQLTTKDSIAQVGTALGDLAITLGDRMAPAVNVVAQAFTDLLVDMNEVAFAQGALNEETIGAVNSQDLLHFALKEVKNEMGQLEGTVTAVWDGFSRLTKAESFNINATRVEREEMERLKQEADLLNARLTELNILTIDSGEGFGVLILKTDNLTTSVSDHSLALAEFETLQQAKLDKYAEEQEMIAALVEKNPELATSLNLVTDASKNVTKAKEAQGKAELDLMKATASAFKEFAGGAKIAARIQQVAATIDAYRTINKIMADPKLVFPTNVLMATAVGATAFANVMSISKSIGEFKTAATGMDEIVTRPTMILAGEAGAESVNITPLSAGAGDVGGAGSSVTVNVTGNVLTQDFVETDLAEAIREASRRGTDFGIS